MSARILAYLLLALASFPLMSQQSPASDEAIQQLRSEVAKLASTLESTRSELQACREEVHQLRTELQKTQVAVPEGLAADTDAAHSVADLREQQQLTDTHVQQLYQTKVESGSKYRVRLSGLVLFNAYANRGPVDNTDVPNRAVFVDPASTTSNIGGTLRQTLFTVQVFGPEVAGAKTSGEAQFDFFGGFTPTLEGYAMGLMRLRTGNINFDWKNWSLRFGQDQPFISPLTPTSFATLGTPSFAYSGNLWTWTPQIVAERRWTLGEHTRSRLQFGVLDPFDGEFPASAYGRAAEAGELSRTPAMAARQSFDFQVAGQTATIGAGGYFARQNYDYRRIADAWAGTLDWTLPLGERFQLSGEFYRGRALGGLWGGGGTSVVYTTAVDSPTTRIIGVNTVGGWSQFKFKPAPKWELNAAFGEDSPFASEVRQSQTQNYYPTLRNWTTMVNVIEHPRSNLVLSLEYRHLNTVLFNGEPRTAEHVNMGVGVAF